MISNDVLYFRNLSYHEGRYLKKSETLKNFQWTVIVNERRVGFPNFYWTAHSDKFRIESHVIYGDEKNARGGWREFARAEGIKNFEFPGDNEPHKETATIKKIVKKIQVPSPIIDNTDLSGLSGSEIIAKVYEITGEKIKVSPKSKQSVIKHAREILEKYAKCHTI